MFRSKVENAIFLSSDASRRLFAIGATKLEFGPTFTPRALARAPSFECPHADQITRQVGKTAERGDHETFPDVRMCPTERPGGIFSGKKAKQSLAGGAQERAEKK